MSASRARLTRQRGGQPPDEPAVQRERHVLRGLKSHHQLESARAKSWRVVVVRSTRSGRPHFLRFSGKIVPAVESDARQRTLRGERWLYSDSSPRRCAEGGHVAAGAAAEVDHAPPRGHHRRK